MHRTRFIRTPIIEKAHRPQGDSPYRAFDEAVPNLNAEGVATGVDPMEIANGIVEAVDQPDGPVHVPVGDSAHWFLNEVQTRDEAETFSFYRGLIGIETPAGASA